MLSDEEDEEYSGSEECWDCGGDGYVERDDWKDWGEEFECSTCQGIGLLHVRYPTT